MLYECFNTHLFFIVFLTAGDNVTTLTLEEKLQAISPENEGIPISVSDIEEDCPVPYVVPHPDHKQQIVSDPVLRDTDATTVTNVVEEKVAEINDEIQKGPEWMDVMGSGSLMKRVRYCYNT